MNPKITIPIILTTCFAFIFIWLSPLLATQEKPETSTLAVFSNQKRPAARFDHTRHEDALGETGCAQCHHVLDKIQNKLVYSEGEEMACFECHSEKKDKGRLSFRDANHASCTICHRTLKKAKKTAGPTTCGECHKK